MLVYFIVVSADAFCKTTKPVLHYMHDYRAHMIPNVIKLIKSCLL